MRIGEGSGSVMGEMALAGAIFRPRLVLRVKNPDVKWFKNIWFIITGWFMIGYLAVN
jgi:hypothetical protein